MQEEEIADHGNDQAFEGASITKSVCLLRIRLAVDSHREARHNPACEKARIIRSYTPKHTAQNRKHRRPKQQRSLPISPRQSTHKRTRSCRDNTHISRQFIDISNRLVKIMRNDNHSRSQKRSYNCSIQRRTKCHNQDNRDLFERRPIKRVIRVIRAVSC